MKVSGFWQIEENLHMHYGLHFWLCVILSAQTSQTTKSDSATPTAETAIQKPVQTPPAVPTEPLPPKQAPTSDTPSAPGQPAMPEPEKETPADKLLLEAADKIDKLKYVAADIVQTIRVGDDRIKLLGEFKRGPDYRMKLLLKVELGESVGERLQISDGKNGYIYDRVLDNETVRQFRVDQIVPLIQKKDLPAPAQRQVLTQLPYLLPGDMLRGFVRSVTFTDIAKGELRDGRKVTAVKGQWRAPVVFYLANNQPSATVDTLPEGTPQYVRVFVDDASGWPVAVELYRRDKSAEYHPVFTFEFRNLKFPENLPDEEFAFTPPKKLVPQDLTATFTSQLNLLKDKTADAPGAPSKDAGAVSEPIAPAGKAPEKQNAEKKAN